jgi:chemotaxis-related protein WspB
MLFLIFSLGADRYALEASEILEVLPVPALKALPNTPEWVAGIASDENGTFPVIDLVALAVSRPARHVMSTRLALLAYPDRTGPHRLGVIVERATSTLRASEDAFEPSGIDTPEACYLGPVLRTDDGVVQRVSVADLLPPWVRERLFTEAG